MPVFHTDLLKGRILAAGTGLFLFFLVVIGSTLGLRNPASIGEQIDALIAMEDSSTAFWGVYVQDVQTGQVIYESNADKSFIPASNQKIVTTATALSTLGKDYRYQTALYFDGKIDGSVMRGDLIIRGSGDPTFGSVEVAKGDPLKNWAQALARMGVRRFEGRIIGDDDVFDDRPYADGWDVDYLLSQASRALGVSASGLSYHDNVIDVKIHSGDVGSNPVIETSPPGYLDIHNEATTSSRRRGWALDVNRSFGTETVNISGSVPRSYAATIAVPVSNPTTFAAQSLKANMQEEGIEVEALTVDIDELNESPEYDSIDPLFVYFSPTLSDIIAIINKESNNFYAEQLYRSFGWGGSAQGAERRAKDLLARAGIKTDQVSFRDGSGLSRKDLVTPRALGQLLVYMYQHPDRDTFLNSLAQGGEPRTTMDYRLRHVPVRAKTGSLEFVRSLSGYATTPEGRMLAFSMLTNNYSAPSYHMMQVMDRMVLAMTTPTNPN